MSHSRAENECRTRRFRFAEQVRSVVAALEAYGQPIEVHLPFYTDSAYDALPTTTLPEFPVYRAPVPVELIEAFWTPNYSEPVEHNLRINLRPGGVAAAVRLQEIASASVTTTAWKIYEPKALHGDAQGAQGPTRAGSHARDLDGRRAREADADRVAL